MPVTFNIRSKPVDADGVVRISLEPGLPAVLEAKGIAAAEGPVRFLHDEDPVIDIQRTDGTPEAGTDQRAIRGLAPGQAVVYVLDKADKLLGKIQVTVKELPATALQAEVKETRPRTP